MQFKHGLLLDAGFTHVATHHAVCGVRPARSGRSPSFSRWTHFKPARSAPVGNAHCVSLVAADLRGRRLRAAVLRAVFLAGADASSAVAAGATVSAGAAISGISSMLLGAAFFAFFAAVLRGARSLRRAGCLSPACGSLAPLSTPPVSSAVEVSADAIGASGSSKVNSLFFSVCAGRSSV